MKNWSAETSGAPFGAHPRRDPDGTLWNIGYAPFFQALIVYRISAAGQLQETKLIPMPQTPMVHDFLITKNYLVFVLPPFRFVGGDDASFLDQFAW